MQATRLLLLVTQLERAGAQKVALMQARYFHQRGYKVTLCFFYDKYSLMEELSQQEAFSIVDLEAKSPQGSLIFNALCTLRAMWRLYRLLHREQIQVVETLTHYSNILGIVVAWLARVPVRVSSQRNTLSEFPRWFLAIDAGLVNSPLVDKMVMVSEQTRDFCVNIQRMKSEKLIVIPNGIDLTDFDVTRWSSEDLKMLRESLSIPLDAIVLITVGRLHPQKGHHYLIQAASTILSDYPQAVFLWVGDGGLRSELNQAIERAGIGGAFRLLGVRCDVPQLLALSTLFVLPSISEGMPNVVLEAMASGLPVVATAVDGTNSLVVAGQTGLLVPPRDSTELANAILELLADPERLQEMGEKAYERVRVQFSGEVMCQRYEAAIRTILEDKAIGTE
ncbi:MAG TPA: glycosyltransferase [Chloroflexi bacterium]|nr:glycosyltransferase [Chloroflexota bacterium]